MPNLTPEFLITEGTTNEAIGLWVDVIGYDPNPTRVQYLMPDRSIEVLHKTIKGWETVRIAKPAYCSCCGRINGWNW